MKVVGSHRRGRSKITTRSYADTAPTQNNTTKANAHHRKSSKSTKKSHKRIKTLTNIEIKKAGRGSKQKTKVKVNHPVFD